MSKNGHSSDSNNVGRPGSVNLRVMNLTGRLGVKSRVLSDFMQQWSCLARRRDFGEADATRPSWQPLKDGRPEAG
jgi:hypothetical protein